MDSLAAIHESPLLLSNMGIKGWLDMKTSGSFARPLTLAVTLDESLLSEIENHFRHVGSFLLWQPESADENQAIELLEKTLAGIRPFDFTGPWVSNQDRSPVRRLHTKYLVLNVTRAALAYCDALIQKKQYDLALETLDWTEEFEKVTEPGSMFTEQISLLRDLAEERKQ